MKMECYVARDLMSEYAEGLTSEKTTQDIREHLAECRECRELCDSLTAPVDKESAAYAAYDYAAETQRLASLEETGYLRKYSRVLRGVKTAAIAVTAVFLAAAALVCLALTGAITLFACASERDVCEDAAQYEEYLGRDGKYTTVWYREDADYLAQPEEKRAAWLDENHLFPYELPEGAQVENFRFEYYDPFDPNYMLYLVCTCDDEAFEREVARLKSVESTENRSAYGAEEYPYELCAVRTDDYYGLMYALADRDNDRLIYFGLNFCNCFTDIEYEKYIDPAHLPTGFDAKPDNPTELAWRKENIEPAF